jgi:hypothetical protein
MTRTLKIALTAFVLLVSFDASSAKEWHGLVPLRSTRSDVVRLLNQCGDQREACRFTLGTEAVHRLFSGGLPAEYSACITQLPPETVMFIEVEPTVKLKLKDLHLDKRLLQRFNPSVPADGRFDGYRSRDGLVVSLLKDEVLQIVYLADESNKHACADYYKQPEAFVEVPILHVAVISSLKGPDTIKAGDNLKISAHSVLNESRGYAWGVSAGKIIAGQYTRQVTIDTTGLAGQTITVTAEIGDVFRHVAAITCLVKVVF